MAYLPNGTSKNRVHCSKCGHKTATPYHDNFTREAIKPNVFMKCSRQNSCGHDLRPERNNEQQTYRIKERATTIQPNVLEKQIIQSCISNPSLFSNFIAERYGIDAVARGLVHHQFVGAHPNDSSRTIFLQLDEEGRLRTGKIIGYRIEEGQLKRDRNCNPSWLHARHEGFITKQHEATQTLFGMHQLQYRKKGPVFIVESEKTAVIAGIYRPDLIWMATGGATGLKSERLAPLHGRQIILVPDADKAGETWNAIASRLKVNGYNVLVWNEWQQFIPNDAQVDGMDIADLLVQFQQNQLPAGLF